MRITVLYPALLALFFLPFTQGIGSAASEVASLTEAKPGTYSHNGPAWRSLTPAPAPLLSGVVSTLAGGANDFADGLGTAARFSYPTDVACDDRGNVYVVDQGNHRIRRIVVATGVVSTLAGSGTEGFADGSGAAAQFNDPRGLAFDGRGHLYVADKGNHRIRCIATATGAVSTLTGSGTEGFADGTGTAAQFKGPADVACDSRGNLYVSDQSNHRVRRIVIATGVVSTLAGSSLGFADGQGSAAQFNYPTGLACDGRGHLYVADLNNHRIRCIATATGAVSTLAGSARGFADGPGPAAQFVNPAGVA